MINQNSDSYQVHASAPEQSIFDYNKSIMELEEFYDHEMEQVRNGNSKLLTGELMQLGYALDFITLVNNNLMTMLDFTDNSILLFENVLDRISQLITNGTIAKEDVTDIIKKATGFFSVLVWKNIGGGFINSNLGYGINVNNTNVFVFNRVGRRILGDKEADMISFYQDIKNLL